MADLDFNPATFAKDMQLRTRKECNFHQVEHDLPDPKSAALKLPAVNVGGWLTKLANLNPWGKQVDEHDRVWLFDNTAYRNQSGQWEAEFVAAVFEQDPKCKVANIVTNIATTVGLAEDCEERKTIEERVLPFLWDIQAVRVFTINHGHRNLRLGPTSVNGITTNVLGVSNVKEGELAVARASVPRGVKGILDMQTYYAGKAGWGIISGELAHEEIQKWKDTNSIRYRRHNQGHHDQ